MADNESDSSNIDNAVQEQLLNAPSEHSVSERAEPASLWAKYTAEELMEDCPYTVAVKVIDTSLWDVPAREDADAIHATTWVAKMIHDYNLAMVWDDQLFDDYKVDFEGWTRDLFLKVDRNTLKSLKTVLRYRGIYTGNNRARVADSLYKTLAMDDIPEWDPAEFQAMTFDHRSKAYQRQQNARQVAPVAERRPSQTILPPHTQAPQTQPQTQQPLQQPLQEQEQLQPRLQPQQPEQGERYGVRQDVRSHSQPQEPQQRLQTQTRPLATTYREVTPYPQTYREVTPFPQQPINRVPARPPDPPHDPYKTLPPRWSRNDRLDANKITQFSKLWDNSNKYTGNAYDLLDDKIKIFFSICWQVDIQEEQFHAVFPRILTGRAETFYIQVVEREDSFADAYMAIKNHFDHDVHHQHYYID